MSLDTLANVKARLGVSGSADDSLLTLLQASADDFIKNWCERDFEGGTFTEYHSGGSAFVYLRNYPVTSITAVKVDPSGAFGSESVIPSSAYVVHTDWGVIQSLGGPLLPRAGHGLVSNDIAFWSRGPRVVQVVYATAAGAVPNDVKEAYARLVGSWYRRVKTESAVNFLDVSQQRFGDAVLSFAPLAASPPDDVRGLLAPYRAPRL